MVHVILLPVLNVLCVNISASNNRPTMGIHFLEEQLQSWCKMNLFI
jgi:hypothetical protein